MPIESLIQASATSPVLGFVLIAGLALLPFLLLAFTAFVKISVVLGILRHALGTGNIPSASVIAVISLLLSFQVASPVLEKVDLSGVSQASLGGELANEKADTKALELETKKILQSLESLRGPFQEFLKQHSRDKEIEFFVSRNPKRNADSFLNLVPAFLLSELREAFAIGFVLFLPFLIIDLVVANLLVGMGMMMVSPVTISLPVKIISFVVFDGWFRISESLILGYQLPT